MVFTSVILTGARPRRAVSWARMAVSGRVSEAVARPASPRTLRRVGSVGFMIGSLPVALTQLRGGQLGNRLAVGQRGDRPAGPITERERGGVNTEVVIDRGQKVANSDATPDDLGAEPVG